MSRLLGRLPISTLMGLAFTVPAALIAALLVGDHYLLARRYLTEEGTRYGEILAAPILSASQRFLREGQVAAVQEMVETTGSHRTVQEIALVGGDGTVIASNRREWIGRGDEVIAEPAYHQAATAARAKTVPEHRRVDGGRRLVLVSPVLFQGTSPILSGGGRGVLYLKIDYERRMNEVVASILWRGALSAGGMIAVSLFLLLWVRMIMTRPILAVAARVRAIPAGGATPVLPVSGPLELAQLADDVDRMARDLEANRVALRASEDQLRQANRMESVASLAGSMAHDFNNLLTGILGYTRLLLDRVGPGDPIRRQLAAIETSAARAADLTSQLLTFSRRAASRPEPVDLGDALGRSLEALRATLPGGVDCRVERPEALWTTAVDVAQLERVLEALCANAREAMPYGGRLEVRFANRRLDEEQVRDRLEARPGRFVTLTIADTGRGIDPEVRQRLFEPFVTTKREGRTAGFGLATAYGLVKGHEGWIEIDSERGMGTIATVWLPVLGDGSPVASGDAGGDAGVYAGGDAGGVAGGEAAAPAGAHERATSPAGWRGASAAPGAAVPGAATPGVVPPGAPATVLAVDDESTVLALARDLLELSGYRVLTARNGEEALRVFREHQARVDLVLLDLTMPVMGGLECFRQMRALDPRVRVVISSGFSSESSAAEMLREGAVDYLAKPYDIQVLAKVVREALAKPRPGASPADGGAEPPAARAV